MADKRIPLERTRLKLEELRRLLKLEEGVISLERAQQLFKKVFKPTGNLSKEFSRFKLNYPSYFKGITIVDKTDKFRNYLLNRAKNLTSPITTSIPALQKAAKTDLKAGTAWSVLNQLDKSAKAKFNLGKDVYASKYDDLYKNQKKFRDYFSKAYDISWGEADGYQKVNAWKQFQNIKKGKIPSAYTLSNSEFIKKIGGIGEGSLATLISKPELNSTARFLKENFDFKRGPAAAGKYRDTTGTSTRFWKDPSETTLRKWKRFLNSRIITGDMKNNIETLYKNDDIYKAIFEDKRLPKLGEVQTALKTKSPATAANSMALLAKVLKGDEFRQSFDIEKNVVAGNRILKQIGELGIRDAYRSAFYNAALSNVDKIYKGMGNTSLSSFKDAFRNELKILLDPKIKEIPFSVNEVIGVSTGEMRGLQPYSAFVDVTAKGINEGALAQYQGRLSAAIGEVQKALAVGDTPKAETIAANLKSNFPNYKGLKDLSPAEMKQLGFADIKIGTEIDPSIYSKADLAKWKKRGLDIQAITDREGFYIDTKGRKPYFDVSQKSFRNVILQAAKTNEGGVCQIFRAEGGRIGYAAGSNCARQMELAFDSDPVRTTEQINKIKTVPEKIKSAGMGFLNFAKRGGKYGAIAAAGAATAGLVKTFMNDDPTTYLSNEDQQKNMLISMITDPIDETPEESPAILDYQLPTLGAVTVAGMVPGGKRLYDVRRRGGPKIKAAGPVRSALGLKGVLGKGLAATATPLGLLALEPLHIAGQVQSGDSLTDIATNPLNYLGPAFAAPLTKEATKFASPMASKIMRMGMSPTALRGLSRFGGVGLAASLGIQGLMKYDDWRNKRGWFSDD